MELSKKIELVKSWGFSAFLSNERAFNRKAPNGFTEWWSVERPDHIEFANMQGEFSHDYKIDWSIFQK